MPEPTNAAAEDPALCSLRLSGLIGGYQVSAAIGAFARLGVADALGDDAATSAELAARLGAHEGALARLLEATLDLGLFTVDDQHRYRLTALGRQLRADAPGSMRRYAIVATEDWRWYAYCHLDRTLRTGEPGFMAAHCCRLWDYLACHPEAAASFEESMSRIGMARDQAGAAAVDLGRFRCVVDVGGGRGGLIRALLTADARLRGILFDLPSVVAGARETLSEAGLAERCDVVAGDFRQSVPRGGDAYVLSWILHDWDDEAAKAILRHCREAMDIGAALLVVEMIVPGLGDASAEQTEAEAVRRLVRQTDLEMLAVVGGRERTAADFEALFAATGFALSATTPLPGLPWSVLEAVAV